MPLIQYDNYFNNSDITPDVSYCYQSAIELLEITRGDISYFLEETSFNLTSLFDDCEINNLNFIEKLDEIFTNWYHNHASNKQKSYIFYKLLFSLENQFEEFNKIVYQYFQNEKLDKRLSYKTLFKQIENKKSSTFDFSTNKIKKAFSFYQDVLNKINLYSQNVFYSLDEIMKEEYNSKRKHILEQDIQSIDNVLNSFELTSLNKKEKITNKKQRKGALKMLNKSIQTLSSFIGTKEVKSFISGDSFFINGNDFNYKVYKKENFKLIQHPNDTNSIHIPYNLDLYTKNNEYLANMCITFPGSPILDQILSVYLMINSGQEKEVLNNSNFYKISSLCKEKYQELLNHTNVNSFALNLECWDREDKENINHNKYINFKNYLDKNIYQKTLNENIYRMIFKTEVTWDEAVDFYSFDFSMNILDPFVKDSLKQKMI